MQASYPVTMPAVTGPAPSLGQDNMSYLSRARRKAGCLEQQEGQNCRAWERRGENQECFFGEYLPLW